MNIPCAAVTTPLEMMDTAVRGLASWRLAESAIAHILCAAVMAPLEALAVEDARPLMVGHVE